MNEKGIETINPKPKIELPGYNLLTYSRQEVTELFQGEIQDNCCFVEKDIDPLIKKLVSYNGRELLTSASSKIIEIKSPTEELLPTTSYVQESNLKKVEAIDWFARTYGIDIFKLEGVTSIKNIDDNEILRISPPLAVRREDGRLEILDGHHRVYLAALYKIPINIIEIKGVNPKDINPFLPTTWDNIKLTSNIPKKTEKRQFRPGFNFNDRIQFGLFGDTGSRINFEEKLEKILGEKEIKKTDLIQTVNKLMHRLRAPGFISSFGRPKLSEQLPEVFEIKDVIDLNNGLIMPIINFKWEEGTVGVYKPLTETMENFNKNGSRLGIVISRESFSEFFQQNHSPLGEIYLNEEILERLNQELTYKGLRNFGQQEYKKNDVPKVIGYTFDEQNKNFFTIINLKLDNGQTIPVVENKIDPKTQADGSVFIFKGNNDKFLLINRHRELFGISMLETPRSFREDPKRIELETGVDISNLEKQSQFHLFQDTTYSNTKNQISVFRIPEFLNEFQKNLGDLYEGTREIAKPEFISGEKINEDIKTGRIVCDITIAAVTLTQLSTKNIVTDPKFESNILIMEKVYNPAKGKYDLVLPSVSPGTGNRLGGLGFPDTGKFLNYRSTEIGSVNLLPKNRFYEGVPIKEIANKALNGDFDISTLAHIRKILTSQKIWLYQS